jgi:hypothetical protein
MGASTAIVGGTFAYIAVGILAFLVGLYLRRNNRLSKDNGQCVPRHWWCCATAAARGWQCLQDAARMFPRRAGA